MAGANLELIGTPRMLGERLHREHAAELAALLRDPRVAASLSPDGPPTDAAVKDIVARQAGAWERDGFGVWLLRDRGTGELVGRGGLQHTSATGSDEVEIGWAIVPERWGEGLATELANASIGVAFGRLELDGVIAHTLVTNAASRRVMDKAGLAFEREFVHASLPHVVYRRGRAA